jgi:hypothetical protein
VAFFFPKPEALSPLSTIYPVNQLLLRSSRLLPRSGLGAAFLLLFRVGAPDARFHQVLEGVREN